LKKSKICFSSLDGIIGRQEHKLETNTHQSFSLSPSFFLHSRFESFLTVVWLRFEREIVAEA